MPLDNAARDALFQHWPLDVYGRAGEVPITHGANKRWVSKILDSNGRQVIQGNAESTAASADLLATACELAMLDMLNSGSATGTQLPSLSLDVREAASAAFELLRTMELPAARIDRQIFVLRTGALAYCGDRWTDMAHVLDGTDSLPPLDQSDDEWDSRILSSLFDCWLALFRMDDAKELAGCVGMIDELRAVQGEFEKVFLDDPSQARERAFTLVSLYNWAHATELLATYLATGMSGGNITTLLAQHFDDAMQSAFLAHLPDLELLMKLLAAAAGRMVEGSVWQLASKGQALGDLVSQSVSRGMIELLPPQRTAFAENLLDPNKDSIVIDLPTSSGKTALAEFRIVQTLSLWNKTKFVIYVAPTRALVNQIARRLRRDLGSDYRIEQLSGAVELDVFESSLLEDATTRPDFDILVSTPEKISLVLRNRRIHYPLALVVIDEAHNLEDQSRGLRLELLIATVKSDYPTSDLMLMTPNVPNVKDLTDWLNQNEGQSVAITTGPWLPNDRIVGIFSALGEGRGNWHLDLSTLSGAPGTLSMPDTVVRVAGPRPLHTAFSTVQNNLGAQAAAMAVAFSDRGCSVAVGRDIPSTWSMARRAADVLPTKSDPDIRLVQRFLQDELGEGFELVTLLDHGVAVHHAGLSDEARILVESLAEHGKLSVLCTTTTIAQGIDFPISSVFLSSVSHFDPHTGQSVPMKTRDFWNLVGRCGRVGQDTLGIVGLAATQSPSATKSFILSSSGELKSQLIQMVDDLETLQKSLGLIKVIDRQQWEEFRSYVAHLAAQRADDEVSTSTDQVQQLLRNTFGYSSLISSAESSSQEKAKLLVEATRMYTERILGDQKYKSVLGLSDSTGFSPEGVIRAMAKVRESASSVSVTSTSPDRLFSKSSSGDLEALFGVMLHLPQLEESLDELVGDSKVESSSRLAAIARDWVSGKSMATIAESYFDTGHLSDDISKACRAIYRGLSYGGTWGLAALTQIMCAEQGVGKDSSDNRSQLDQTAAMLYYGVNTSSALLMRMHGVPRFLAPKLGQLYQKDHDPMSKGSVKESLKFVSNLSEVDWRNSLPSNAHMSGADCRNAWKILTGRG